ncbi:MULTISPECIES: hypothetical protein [unclassified Streptomyces]|uniref:hypothetical protein n=1 Tax=unclassified Streptomyces TaxID=2593676 RepID=UPI00093E608A|nr:hypothetical protein [Streptomyces sp. TSRI0281]OKI34967.1 hypothetical protein A6A29_16205 [Streptomyces sp. TSRI0281]
MTYLVTRDPVTGLRRGPFRWPDGIPPESWGCRWCGISYRQHRGRVSAAVGWHPWAQPTPGQVFARMMARRRARIRAAAESRRLDPGYAWVVHTGTNTPPARCDAMNHNSVGSERFCELDEGHGPGEDHDAGDITWPCED